MDNFRSDYSASRIALQYLELGGYGLPRANHMNRRRMHAIFEHLLEDGLTTETKNRVITWMAQNPIEQDGK